MPIYKGSTEVTDLKLGGTQVKSVYQGSNLIWSSKQLMDSWVQDQANGNYTVDFRGRNFQAGDIAIHSHNAFGEDTHTLPGFTKVISIPYNGQDYMVIWAKVLDGTETLVTSVGGENIWKLANVTGIFRGFSGWSSGTTAEVVAPNPDPPAITGVSSSDWVICSGYKVAGYNATAPTGYNLVGSTYNTINGISEAAGMLAYLADPTAGTIDPPPFGGGNNGYTFTGALTVRLIV